ncbi:ATP-dependent nuclease [Marinobacter nauticus]|uniref:ATP-dependent nuclease n=1 Tax=Marinobacter nauticus TaxID=2743 RepID=UPI000310075D|nr:AAA family ATPase [Marinobacter nauticus]
MRSAAITRCWEKTKEIDAYPVFLKEIKQINAGFVANRRSNLVFRPDGVCALVGNVGAGKTSFFEFLCDKNYSRRQFLDQIVTFKDGSVVRVPDKNINAIIIDPSRELRELNSIIFQYASTFDQNDTYQWSGDELSLLKYVLGEDYQAIGFEEIETANGYVPRFVINDGFRDLDNAVLSQGEQLVLFLYWCLTKKHSRPGLFLIEEPEIGLSPATQTRLLDMLAVVSSERKKQFIISTHSPSIVSALGSKNVFLMKKDRVCYWLPSNEDNSLEELGLKLGKKRIVFVEDRKAGLMLEYLLSIYGSRFMRRAEIIFLGGESHVYEVVNRIQSVPSEISFIGVLDADEKGNKKYEASKADFLFLPGSFPPEIEVSRVIKRYPDRYAGQLMIPTGRVLESLERVRGLDGHDFFEELGKQIFGQYRNEVFTAGVAVWFLVYDGRTEVERLLVELDPAISGSTIVSVNQEYPVSRG